MMGWNKVRLIAGTALRSLAVVLLLTTVSYAQVNWQKFSYFTNYGGLNDHIASTEIKDDEATDIQNMVFDTAGTLQKRHGYTTCPLPYSKVTNSILTVVNGLKYYQKNNGDAYLVAVANANGNAVFVQKKFQTGGGLGTGSWVDISTGTITAFSDNYRPSFAIASDDVIMAIPTTTGKAPYMWDGGAGSFTPLTTDADCPKASIVVYHKNQLFLNDTTRPSRIWFSGLPGGLTAGGGTGNITTYEPTDFIDVDSNDGMQIRGMISAFDCLYIFKDQSIWKLSGYDRDSFRLDQMIDGIGTLSNQSICSINNTIFFITPQNDIAAYDGAYNVVFLSDKIHGTISKLNFQSAANAISVPYSTYRFNDFDLYTSVCTGGKSQHDLVLMHDNDMKAWTKLVGINASAWCVGPDSNGQNALYFGDYSGYIHQYPSTGYYDGNVATAPITAYYQTKWFRYPEIFGNKYWRLLKSYILSENTADTYIDTYCRSDYEAEGKLINIPTSNIGTMWDASTWDVDKWAGQSLIVDRREINKGTQMFQVKWQNTATSQGFTLLGYEIFIEPSDKI